MMGKGGRRAGGSGRAAPTLGGQEQAMSETSTESGVESNGKERAAHKGVFATAEEARQVQPPSDKFRVYRVTSPTGGEVFTWAWTGDGALANAARADGYKAGVSDPKGGGSLTKERVV